MARPNSNDKRRRILDGALRVFAAKGFYNTRVAEVAREAGVPYELELPSGICDYALYRENGEILAIVEAKRTRRDARVGDLARQSLGAQGVVEGWDAGVAPVAFRDASQV